VEPIFVVGLITAIASILFVLVQRFLVDQERLRELREQMGKYKKLADEARKKGKIKDVNRYTTLMLQLSSEQFRFMFRSMIFIFIIIGPVFFLLSSLYPDVVVKLEGDGMFEYEDFSIPVTAADDGIYLENKRIGIGETFQLGKYDFELNKNCGLIFFFCADPAKEVKFSRIIVYLPFSLPFLGANLGWLGWYIFLSITITTLLRKLLGVI
jgi:uncharacterized membrane protein (DUF106 family)